MSGAETFVIILFVLFIIFVVLPDVLNRGSVCTPKSSPITGTGTGESKEGFATKIQYQEQYNDMDLNKTVDNMTKGIDYDENMNGGLTPKSADKNYESVIYDSETKSVMTGSEFMKNTGINTPYWIAPAWNPSAHGPSSKGKINPEDYENDPRMLYNKCSISCCSPQYPTPFQGDPDPFVCDKNGNNKYVASNYMCQNNAGGTGCLCMTPKQAKGFENGFVDYYVDKENLGY